MTKENPGETSQPQVKKMMISPDFGKPSHQCHTKLLSNPQSLLPRLPQHDVPEVARPNRHKDVEANLVLTIAIDT
jgi:hypothetical protein